MFTAPAEFPGAYVVHNGLQGTQCVLGTWTFPIYTYTGAWLGRTVTLNHVRNVTVEGLPDAALIGQIANFQTDDPFYACLDGEAINVWTAANEFPGVYVVHNGAQGSQCAFGTWTFPPP